MCRDFLTLTEICENYQQVFVDGNIFLNGIDKLFPLRTPYLESSKQERDYFEYFCKHALELSSLLNKGSRIFTNVQSMQIFERGIGKLIFELRQKPLSGNEKFVEKISQCLEAHKISYRILDEFIVRIDSRKFKKIKRIARDRSIPVGILSLYTMGLERQDRGISAAIVTNNFKFRKCLDSTENAPKIFIGDKWEVDPFYYLSNE